MIGKITSSFALLNVFYFADTANKPERPPPRPRGGPLRFLFLPVPVLHLRPQLFQRPLLDAGDIASADPAARRRLPLGQGFPPAQAVAQADDLRFPGREARLHQLQGLALQLPAADLLQQVAVLRQRVQQRQPAPVPVRLHVVAEAHVPGGFAPGAQIH